MRRALIPLLAAAATLVAGCETTQPTPKIAACASPGASLTVDARVENGRAVPEPHRVHVPLDTTVQVRVDSDTAVPVHIHGFEIEYDAAPGAPGCVSFVADRAGLFDVEAHPSTLLVQLEVR